MIVILENDILALIKINNNGGLLHASELTKLLRQIDEFTVGALRPMVEAPRDGTPFLVKSDDAAYLQEAYIHPYTGDLCLGFDSDIRQASGWIPMVKYSPPK